MEKKVQGAQQTRSKTHFFLWMEPSSLALKKKKFSYLLIAKPCEHLAGTRYSHQTLQEILEYFRLCKWRAAEEAQTALGTAQLFHGPHLVATDTCTPVTPPELWRGNDVRMKFKTRITSTIRNLAAGKRSQTPLAVKHTHSRRKEVCWPKVTRWPLPFSAACAIFACVVPNLAKLKLLQVQIDFYRFTEPPLSRCKKKNHPMILFLGVRKVRVQVLAA